MALSYEIKNFFFLNSHDRISISVTKYTEKQKLFSYSVLHTYTQIKWRFSNFVIKSGPSRHICYKTHAVLTYCVYLGLLEIEMTNWSHYAFTFLIEMLHCFRIYVFNPRLTKLFFVTRLTKGGGCYNPLPRFSKPNPLWNWFWYQ